MGRDSTRRGPLARYRVIDLTRVRSGPTAVRQLGDWGADVIKIESPPDLHLSDGWGGARHGPDFQNLHRNKRAFTLNLKDPDGIAILRKLAEGETESELLEDYPHLGVEDIRAAIAYSSPH